MKRAVASLLGVSFNVAAGVYLYMVPAEQMPPGIYWTLIIAIPIIALLSIFTFGTLTLGWAGMMSGMETEHHQPGSERAIALYDATIGALKDYSRLRFYISFAASILLMAGIAAQGWTFILVLEILGSAIGYGFVHWVMNNVRRMHERAYGKTAE